MKFKNVGFKKCMLKVVMDTGVEQWMDIVGDDSIAPEALKKVLAEKYKSGDDIKLDYTQNDNDYQLKNVVLEGGQATVAPTPPVAETKKPDAKVTTGSVTKKTTYKQASQYTPSSRNTGESIERQCAAKATAEVMKALTGRIDETNVITLIDSVYDKIISKIQG